MFPSHSAPIAALVAGVLLFGGGAARADYLVSRTPVQDQKAVYGTVESVDTLMARTRIAGTVGDVTVGEGDLVTAGQKIAVVADRKLILQMQSLDARIRSAAAELQQAEIDFNRAKELRQRGVIPQARLDDAGTALSVSRQNLQAVKSERDVIAQRAAEGAVLAPGAGRVLAVHVTDGTAVQPGELVASIAAENYILRLRVPERHARFMQAGDPVKVAPRDGTTEQGDLADGVVKLVYPQLDQGRLIADVEVEGLGTYFVGERVLVRINTGERSAFVVPGDYLFDRFGVTYARLADGTDVVVQPGRSVEGGVEVLSGLRDGDDLIKPESGQ